MKTEVRQIMPGSSIPPVGGQLRLWKQGENRRRIYRGNLLDRLLICVREPSPKR
jgi:hypothetical protein